MIRPEATGERMAIHEVIRLAFGRDDEARLVDELREGGHARVALVAELEAKVVGHVFFGDMAIATSAGPVGALALAPLSVMPLHQRRGIGTALVVEGLRACRSAGHRIVVVLGDPRFYGRFGFSAALVGPLRSPFPGPAFQALELVPGALDGVAGEVRYPPPFGLP